MQNKFNVHVISVYFLSTKWKLDNTIVQKFFEELTRRKVISAMLIYAMAVWLILQVSSVVVEPLLIPSWVERAIVIGAVLGFPIVAVLSWIFDLTSAGLVETDSEDDLHRKPLGIMTISLTLILLLVIASFISLQWGRYITEKSLGGDIVAVAIMAFQGDPNASETHLLRLPEELYVRLNDNPNIRLASANAISLLPDASSLSASANQLGVDYLIGGTIKKVGEKVDLSVWLYSANDSGKTWQSDFENAQIYVVNELIVNELLTYFNLQQDVRGVLTQNANAYDLYLRGLESLVISRDQSEAVALFEQAIAEDSSFPLPHAQLCRYQVRQYRRISSIEEFEKAERFCFKALTLDDSALEVHDAMGQIYIASGKKEKARESFSDALSINAQHFASKLGLARTYLTEDPILAESLLSELKREQPGDPSVYSTLQNLYFNLGRYNDAVAPARIALKLRPNSESAKFNLAANLLLAANFAESKALLLDMLKVDSPRSGSIQSNLATVYFFEGNYSEAADLYRAALDKEPENTLFARNLADVAWHQEGSESAKSMFENVIEIGQRHLAINSNNIEVLSCLMVAFGSVGNAIEVESALVTLLELSSEDPQVYYDAAVAYSRLGNRELSAQYVNISIELGYPPALIKSDPDLRQLL